MSWYLLQRIAPRSQQAILPSPGLIAWPEASVNAARGPCSTSANSFIRWFSSLHKTFELEASGPGVPPRLSRQKFRYARYTDSTVLPGLTLPPVTRMFLQGQVMS